MLCLSCLDAASVLWNVYVQMLSSLATFFNGTDHLSSYKSPFRCHSQVRSQVDATGQMTPSYKNFTNSFQITQAYDV